MNRILIALALLTVGSSPVAAEPRPWIYETGQDQISDDRVDAASSSDDRAGQKLIVGCKSHQPIVLFWLKHIDLVFGDQREFIWRIDDNEPVFGVAGAGTDINGGFVIGSEAVAFIKAVRDAKERVVIRSEGTTVAFPAKGSTAAINKVMTACDGL